LSPLSITPKPDKSLDRSEGHITWPEMLLRGSISVAAKKHFWGFYCDIGLIGAYLFERHFQLSAPSGTEG
jgi:hypothetical protein